MTSRFLRAADKSFGFKILVAITAVIIVVLTAFTFFAVIREKNKMEDGLREKGAMLTGLLADSARLGVFAENSRMAREAAQGIIALDDVVAVSIHTSGRKSLFSTGNEPALPEVLPSIEQPLTIDESRDGIEFIRTIVSRAAALRNESLYFDGLDEPTVARVTGYVRVVLGKQAYRREIRSVVLRNGAMMAVFIAAGALLVYGAVRRVTRPLERLTANVRALGSGRHVEPVPVDSADEIGNLASEFNAMVVRRQRAEQSLRESEERYRQLVELSPDAIYVQQAGNLLFINAAGVTLLGAASARDVQGRPVRDLMIDDERGSVNRRLQQVEEECLAAPILAVKYRRPNGSLVDAEATAAPFMANGKRAVLVIARDVTKRKAMEEKIQLYERELYAVASEMTALESRVEERERNLIAADLHDYVGQSLVVSQFKLGSLRKALIAPDTAGLLDEVRDLIAQTIQYTRSLTIELSPPTLVEIGLEAAIRSLAEQFERSHGIEIEVEDDGLPKETGDDTRYLLFRSVRELIMNVVKHARAHKAVVLLRRLGHSIRISVSDDGIGFDQDRIEGAQGGFGLYTIRERMRRVGGSCEIDSKPGIGAAIILTAPVKKDQGAKIVSPDADIQPHPHPSDL